MAAAVRLGGHHVVDLLEVPQLVGLDDEWRDVGHRWLGWDGDNWPGESKPVLDFSVCRVDIWYLSTNMTWHEVVETTKTFGMMDGWPISFLGSLLWCDLKTYL